MIAQTLKRQKARRFFALSAAAGAALLPSFARATLPTATGRSIAMSTSGYSLWIPDGYVSRGNVADILVFYHGDPTTVRNNLLYSNLNTILVTVNLGGFSSSYQTPYSGHPELFGNIVTEARDLVRAQADFDDSLTFDKVNIASFSAGWAAVREIFKDAPTYSSISGYAAMDTIYASFGNGSTPPPSASQMVNFKQFALDSKNGAKTMVLSHTMVQTYTYCNTQECADDIMTYIGVTPTSYTTTGLGSMPFYRFGASGNFTMCGEPGADAAAHSLNLQQSGQFFAELPLNSVNETLTNGQTLSTDVGISSGLAYTGATTGATISGQVQLPRRGADHNFDIANGSAASDLNITGRIWGVGTSLTKIGAGTLTLSGSTANTFSGLTTANAGVLELNKTAGVNAVAGAFQARLGGTVKWLQSHQAADTSALTINGVPSTADLNGKTETIASLSFFAGTMSLGSGALTCSGAITANSTTSTAFITGNGTIIANSLNAQGNLTRSGGGVTRLTGSTLTIGGTRKLDLTDTRLITQAAVGSWNGTNYTGVLGLVKTGRNGGAWNGNGGIITSMNAASSAASLTTLAVAANSVLGKTTFGGQSIGPADVLVMYTYVGDADLDGGIDGDDYFRIDSNIGLVGGSVAYTKGDFNYDGRVDADDYWLIDRSYGRQGAPFSASLPAQTAAVPEPSSLILLPLAGLIRRRRPII